MKNSITLALIICSIFLLLALQVIWLRSAYEKALYDLRRESSLIFRNTVFQLRDSIFVNTIQPSVDSTFEVISKGQKKRLELLRAETIKSDSIIFRRRPATVQVYISSSDVSDSLVKSLGPISRKFQSLNRDGNQNFTIRIAPDSLNVDSLTSYFQKNLLTSSIAARSKVYEIKFRHRSISLSRFPLPAPEDHGRGEYHIHEKEKSLFRDTLDTEPARLNPDKYYGAYVAGIRGILLKEITPQFLFSLFLTLTIIAAFLFMYRNIRSQQKLMLLKNDFISNITHELKTPVATVSVALEALKDFDVTANPARSKEYISIAQSELNRLSEITDKILRTTVFEGRGVTIDNESVDLKDVVEKSSTAMQLLIKKAGAEIAIHKTDDDCAVSGSTLHLINVVSNLIENSLKYTCPDRPALITISLFAEKKVAHLSLKDNGIGIAEEYQQKVFEKFFRVPTGNIHTVKGYGLGLSYVSNVVEAHKGSIKLISTLGEGSEFIITLPIHEPK